MWVRALIGKSEQEHSDGKPVAASTTLLSLEALGENLHVPKNPQAVLSAFSCVIDDRNNYQRVYNRLKFIEVLKSPRFHGNPCYIPPLSGCDANYCHLPLLVSVTTPQGELHLQPCHTAVLPLGPEAGPPLEDCVWGCPREKQH